MKFILTYDGESPSSGNNSKKVQEKWDIRKTFDPQLRNLWRIHPALIEAEEKRVIPANEYLSSDIHHSLKREEPLVTYDSDYEIDLFEPIERGGRKFKPLVREGCALLCGLKILFLRQESPGKVYQGGDLDNRVKTLLDALCIPPKEQVVADPTIEDPIYCLLEDDSLISALDVETERLLTRPNAPQNEVRLVIEVDVRVAQARAYNALFLGR